MPIPCPKRQGSSSARKSRPSEPSKKGNGTQTYGDKDNMERAADNRVELKPGWDGPSRVVRTNS